MFDDLVKKLDRAFGSSDDFFDSSTYHIFSDAIDKIQGTKVIDGIHLSSGYYSSHYHSLIIVLSTLDLHCNYVDIIGKYSISEKSFRPIGELYKFMIRNNMKASEFTENDFLIFRTELTMNSY
jgi:hypothetical protein